MADDDRYRWLDRATAERLLSGESLEASLASAGPEARDEAERLAKTLGALSVDAPPNGAELPGEAAALAAFRKARPTTDTAAVTDPGTESGRDMGLVRVGVFGRSGSRARPARWGRPLRLGLSAALAAGMVGSVAVAAGAGVLPNPFRGDEPGRPAATVSAAESRDPMLASPSPDGSRGKGAPSLRPDSTTGSSVDNGSAGREEAQEGTAGSEQGPRSDMSLPGDWRSGLASSCRDMRSGKKLEAERRRALEKAAKGSTKVSQYCEDTLNDEPDVSSNSDTGTGTGAGEGDQSGAGDTGGKGNAVTGDDKGNGGGGDGRGNGSGTGRGDRAATKPTPEPTSFVTAKTDDPQSEPAPEASDPSYGILPLPTAT